MDNLTATPPISRASASHGWLWFRNGWQIFMRSPINWLVMCVLLMAGLLVLSMIPVASLLLQIIMPGFSAGLMLAAHALQHNESINIGYLLAGFRRNSNELVTLGVISLIANVLILLIAAMVVAVFGGATFIETLSSMQSDAAPSEEMLGVLLLVLMLVLALSIPLLMALWFAPALVVLNNLKAMTALKTSFAACQRNMIPFLVYGLVGIPLMIAAAIPFGLGFIVLIPVVFCSIYCAWQDVFGETKEN
ncbi:MAG: hypothetical protein QG652_1752 [Pseudomonadota bacterium]|nr:hypothetical protein [Pseudomonadota bacterium]